MNAKKTRKKEDRYSVTEGRLLPSFVMFLLPLIAAGCLQQSYTIADGLILGNYISQSALGSVSTCGSILDVCTLLQISLAGGCSILVSHLYGAGRKKEVCRLVQEMRSLIVIISVAIGAAAFAAAPFILRLIHTPDELFRGAVIYMRICFIGVPLMSLYSLQSGLLRGMGDSRRPLGGIAVSSGVNIGLDFVCVVLLRLGIAGAAIATVAAEALSAAYLWLKLNEKMRFTAISRESVSGISNLDSNQYHSSAGQKSVHIKAPEHIEGCTDNMAEMVSGNKDDSKGDSNVRECIRLSTPQMIQSVVNSGGNVLLQNITNILGPAVVIGVTVAFKVDSLLFIPLLSFGTAVSVFTGLNTGAGRPDRVRETLRTGIVSSLCFAAVMTLILWLRGYPLFTLFGLEAEAAATGYRYLLICLPFYWIFGLQFVFNGYLNGLKHTAVTSAGSIAGLAGRLALAYLGYMRFGADILPASEALSWIIAVTIDIASIIYFRNSETGDGSSFHPHSIKS